MYIFVTGYQPDDNSNEDDNIDDDNIFQPNNIIGKYKLKEIHLIQSFLELQNFQDK